MGVGSVDLDRRNKERNLRSSTMSNVIAIQKYFPSKKKEALSFSRRKQYQSEEFTVDSSVDKYTQLMDTEEDSIHKKKKKDHRYNDKTMKIESNRKRRGSNASTTTLKTVASFCDHDSRTDHQSPMDDWKAKACMRIILAAARGALPICIAVTTSYS